ncbi:hypothetical protein PHLCEN_2v9983 [Hermanssonia centrifuga]|uniref:Uncharacterized protein n=1 Tax=Hermanssonia centrifuga TaxID=98765 RepID=A0A2R6NP43_9APHY|nr:hypothetical protein PHLCEN_2v9983 [Hermanssonia centrifuga]
MAYLSTTFAAKARLAGPDATTLKSIHRDSKRSTKAGLGLDLPTDVLHTSFTTVLGLGLYIDYPVNDASTIESTSTNDLDTSYFSPPMLPSRRSPRPPPALSPSSEFAPMRTPSPSLRASPFDMTLNLPAPSAPSLQSSPVSTPSPRSTTSVGLGIDIPGLNHSQLTTSIHPEPGVGLGLDIPGLDAEELLSRIQNPSFTTSSHLPYARYATTFSKDRTSPPSGSRPQSDSLSELSTSPSSPSTDSSSALNSPFWGTYAMHIGGVQRKRKLDPVIEEVAVIYETPGRA